MWTNCIASHIAWRRCHFTVPMRHLWYFVANSLFMFHAHQPNAMASDKSCKYMHGLVKCLFNYDLFWPLWTCLILLFFFLCACVDTDLGVNQIAEGTAASATIRAGSAICAAGERWRRMGIVGSLPGREQKTDPTSGLILTHEIWDGTSASLLPTSVSLGLWYCDSEQQRLIVLDLARQRICMGLQLSA